MSIDDRKTQDVDDEPPRDDELRVLYRQLPVQEPRAALDDAILAAARRAAGAAPKRMPVQSLPRVLRWAVPFATAASLVLVVMLARDEHPERAAMPEALQEMAPAVQVEGDVVTAPARAAPNAKPPANAGAKKEMHADAMPESVMTAPAAALADAAVAAAPTVAPASPPQMPRKVETRTAAPASTPAADVVEAESAPVALVKEEHSSALPARRKSVARESTLPSSAGTAAGAASAGGVAAEAAPVLQAVAPADWPWSTPVGARIDRGWLAGYSLLSRAGGPRDASAVFVVRGVVVDDDSGDAAGWRDAIAGRLVHMHGWNQADTCGVEAGLRLLKEGAQVTLQAGSGMVVVAWRRDTGCGQ